MIFSVALPADAYSAGRSVAPIVEVAYNASSSKYSDRGWSLDVRHDRFTGETRCQLRTHGGRLQYQSGALGFRLGKQALGDAWYKLDQGPAKPWRSRFPDLLALGVRLDGGPIDNPTRGMVWLPANDLLQTQAVTIRANRHAHPRTFHLNGFASMLEKTRAEGCTSDRVFAA